MLGMKYEMPGFRLTFPVPGSETQGRKTLACFWSLAKNKIYSNEGTPCTSGNAKATVPRMYSQDPEVAQRLRDRETQGKYP